LAILWLTAPFAQAQPPPPLGEPDLSIMIQLRDQYGWGAAAGWPQGTNPCPRSGPNWAGVTCTKQNERVESIIVECISVKLHQPIPPILNQLTALKDLAISGCGLYGPIGNNFTNLTGLTRLFIAGSALRGPIPSYLPLLPNLLTLELKGNLLSGPIPPQPNTCSRLTRYQFNQLTEIPAGWTHFNRDLTYNCLANAQTACSANQCESAPDGSNNCGAQRADCSSTLVLSKVAGDGQRTQANTAFANPLQVRVTDIGGAAVTAATVNFAGPGIAPTSAITDSSGLASAFVAANSLTGGNTVTASIGTAMVTFGLTAGSQTTCSPSILVTSTADSGAGTLRQALAEVCPGGTVDLNGIAGQTVSLSPGASSYNFSGRLYLAGDVTIEGRGATINGNGKTRIFFVQGGQVVLRNLILTNGLGLGGSSQYGGPAAGMGGAIFQNSGVLTLSGVTLAGNSAQGGNLDSSGLPSGGGFGANSSGGDLGGNSVLGDGRGGAVGGIVGEGGGFGAGGNAGTAVEHNATGTVFLTYGGQGGFGGAAGGAFGMNNGLPLTSRTQDIWGGWGASGNGGAGFGGAIFVRSGSLNLFGVTLTGNQAIGGNGAHGKGGALFLYRGATATRNGDLTFSGNVAAQAGAGGIGYSDETYKQTALCPGEDNANICGATPVVTAGVAVSGNGSVRDGANSFTCTSTCVAPAATALTATPANGHLFSAWSGSCSGTGACTLAAGGFATATFVPGTAPMVTTHPSNATVNAGQNAMFNAAASGNPAPTVQWQVSINNGPFNDVPGSTSTTLTVSSTQASQNGNRYRAVFTNSVSSANTNPATLTVQTVPQVSQNPGNLTVNALTTATFTAAATGNPAPSVQWQVSVNSGPFNDIPGATSTTLAFQAQFSQNGNQYRAVFTNAVSSVPTTAATLTVNRIAPVITWANPAPIAFGSALGATQLRATANTPGAFVYTPPAGTVLPPGNGQQLSTAFTPADSNYSNAGATVPINVTSSGATAVNLVVTSMLRRESGEMIATVNIANTGATAAQGVSLTRGSIGATNTITTLPIAIGAIGGTSSVQITVRFPASVGVPGALTTLSLGGAYTGGTFNSTARVTLP